MRDSIDRQVMPEAGLYNPTPAMTNDAHKNTGGLVAPGRRMLLLFGCTKGGLLLNGHTLNQAFL
ncbi:hypothetical protein J2I47_19600 [Fibrella sp. HMF5335]|uniref:Uncharacterized protein n=1 Tax=Fibrella rubiginis TaxID=2817060 RepID=A0A939GL74_9BACT|nr:hypothetical protein [Fibrella rubiginis]MBO0938766.1 hypothetical protein [Fibrella rubiginis]